MPSADALPYRPCVGLVLIGPGAKVFAGQRIDNPGDAWQMPQGGVDPGEAPAEAALRELEEETGATQAMVEVLRESADWLPYDLPPELVGQLWGGRYRGQTQKWFALRFLGRDADIDIAGRKHPEFSAWAWMPPALLIERIVPFKRAIYAQVFEEFADLLE
ncbi:MAG: RNA pyrophosphohydrolase [Rhodobacteraceae bacterium]|nr:MAG: RNA pyrophosphohydrolase [Paracoccaceae bacterium]